MPDNTTANENAKKTLDWQSTTLLPLEASGVVQLPDGRLLVINDERDNALTLLTLDQENSPPPRLTSVCHPFIGKYQECALDDLEGVTLDNKGRVYVINANGMLTRCKVLGNRITSLKTCAINPIQYFESKPDACNVEGLCWDRKENRLLIGFRNPLSDKGEAQIGVLTKVHRLFKDCAATLKNNPMTLINLDLNGCAIRDITPYNKGFLILSGPPDGYSGEFNLFYWDGKDQDGKGCAIPMVIKDGPDLKHAEGLSLLSFNDKRYVILVRDRSSDLKKLVKKCPDLWECVVDECPVTEEPKKPVPAVIKKITMPGKYLLVGIKALEVVTEAHTPCKSKEEDSSDAPISCS